MDWPATTPRPSGLDFKQKGICRILIASHVHIPSPSLPPICIGELATPTTEGGMIMPSALAIIATAISSLIAFLYFRRSNEKRNARINLPPGKSSIPLIGDTFSLFRTRPLTTLGGFMQDRISMFGKIFLCSVMGSPTVVSADADVNHFVLKNEKRAFDSCRPSSASKKLMGSFDKATRAFIKSSLVEALNGKLVRSVFLEDADQHASRVLSTWKRGSVISAKHELTKLFLSLTVKRFLSAELEDPDLEKLSRAYDSFTAGLCSLPIYLPGTTFWKAVQSRKYIVSYIMGEIEKRIAAGGDQGDFMGFLLKPGCSFTKELVGDCLANVILGGQDSISRAIALAIYFLHACPKAVATLREEHLHILRSKEGGDAKLTWDDYKAMEFTKHVISEILRIGNVSGVIQREVVDDTEINDFVVPRGFKVLLHFQAVHLDPDIYEEPEQFNPWRWLSAAGTRMSKNFMGFGWGEHHCPGAEIARSNMAVFLHHFVLKYDWELAEPDHPLKTPLVEFPKGLPIKIYARRFE